MGKEQGVSAATKDYEKKRRKCFHRVLSIFTPSCSQPTVVHVKVFCPQLRAFEILFTPPAPSELENWPGVILNADSDEMLQYNTESPFSSTTET